MHQHIDNAMDTLLQGLQDLDHFIDVVIAPNKNVIAELDNIRFFISAIANLTEALDVLRLDTNYVLKDSVE